MTKKSKYSKCERCGKLTLTTKLNTIPQEGLLNRIMVMCDMLEPTRKVCNDCIKELTED